MQTASVDPVSSTGQAIVGGRVVSTPVKSYHLRGRCYDDNKGQKTLPNAA